MDSAVNNVEQQQAEEAPRYDEGEAVEIAPTNGYAIPGGSRPRGRPLKPMVAPFPMSDRETTLLATMLLHSEGLESIDWDGASALAGYSVGGARNSWRKLRDRINQRIGQPAGLHVPAGTSKKRPANWRPKQDASATGEGDEEPETLDPGLSDEPPPNASTSQMPNINQWGNPAHHSLVVQPNERPIAATPQDRDRLADAMYSTPDQKLPRLVHKANIQTRYEQLQKLTSLSLAFNGSQIKLTQARTRVLLSVLIQFAQSAKTNYIQASQNSHFERPRDAYVALHRLCWSLLENHAGDVLLLEWETKLVVDVALSQDALRQIDWGQTSVVAGYGNAQPQWGSVCTILKQAFGKSKGEAPPIQFQHQAPTAPMEQTPMDQSNNTFNEDTSRLQQLSGLAAAEEPSETRTFRTSNVGGGEEQNILYQRVMDQENNYGH